MSRSSQKQTLLIALIIVITSIASSRMSTAQSTKQITSIEGITEYELANGLRVLLYPDDSKPKVTVNLTVFVGSRHEGYGEAGMAHLLEHMLFKGTPLHPAIPKVLQERGAQFNGTTWTDRTNYYETLPATDDNLEFAIRLEADRMVNSFIKGEDLKSEMTVVRNEFERGENSPSRVLMQRMQASAYEWHNYGQSTIGNRSDIERVPIGNLQRFYRKHYQPDNAMLIVAGSFEPEKALELIEKYFGVIDSPQSTRDSTYTEEPAQDGERTVALRRVGDVAIVAAAYHIPSGAHPDFAAVRVLSNILGTEPSGRLYKSLVETKKASAVSTYAFAYHDPGLIMMDAEFPADDDMEEVRQIFLSTLESIGEEGVTEEEVQRARDEILSQRELQLSDTQRVAIALTDWAAQGDWRLFFIYRDRVETVSTDDVKRVANKYIRRNNRTVGLFIPTDKAERVAVDQTPSLEKMLDGYEGREQIAAGEKFDPSPENIAERTQVVELSNGVKVSMLPKKTKGESVVIDLNLRYGDADVLKGKVLATEILPELMTRGTKLLSYQEIQDALSVNRTSLSASGVRGLASFSVKTKRDRLEKSLKILRQVLREPSLPEEEFEVRKRELLAQLEQGLNEPQALAVRKLRKITAPFPEEDVRYQLSVKEEIQRLKETEIGTLREMYEQMLAGVGEISIVGDFDPEEVLPMFENMFADWKSDIAFKRIGQEANTDVGGSEYTIETPDKSNAFYISALSFPMKDNDPEYAALSIGNFILGGGALSSRLGDRVRQKEGLSYGVRSISSAHPIDDRGSIMVYAITNPQNRDKLKTVIREELDKLLADGVTQEELDRAKEGYLQSREVRRTEDTHLASMLNENSYIGRSMDFHANHEQQVQDLTVDQVNNAMKKYLIPDRLTIVTAGDFENNPPEAAVDDDAATDAADD